MIIAIHGIVCVGKTTIGKLIANELQYSFYDLDMEMKKFYNDTIINIQKGCFGTAYDDKKTLVLKSILTKCECNTVIAVSPIYYARKYQTMFKNRKVLSIVLHDTPENIVNRLVYTDDNDVLLDNPERNRKEELSDMKYFISRYKNAFSRIENHYDIAGNSAINAAHEIIRTIITPQMTSDAISDLIF